MLSQKTEYMQNSGGPTSSTWSISYMADAAKSNPSTVQVSSPLDGQSIYALNYTNSGSNRSDGLVQSLTRKTYDGTWQLDQSASLSGGPAILRRTFCRFRD